MATKITDTEMSSNVTLHAARAWPVPDEPTTWSVTWLPGRALTRDQAITAMTIAEAIVEHADDLADNGSRWWLQINQWAAELGITGPHAVAEASLGPEDHVTMPRVRVILPEPGPLGYLLAIDPATGKATVRIDGETVTMDARRLQYQATRFPLVAGAGPETADEDGDAVWAAPADGRGNGPLDLTHPERSELISVMTPDEMKVLLVYIAGYAPEVFDHAVADRSETFADELFGRIEERDQAEYMAEPDGYCTACGENASWFIGYEGPQHFRGPHKLVTGTERRELFTPEDNHAPQVAWRQSGGAS